MTCAGSNSPCRHHHSLLIGNLLFVHLFPYLFSSPPMGVQSGHLRNVGVHRRQTT